MSIAPLGPGQATTPTAAASPARSSSAGEGARKDASGTVPSESFSDALARAPARASSPSPLTGSPGPDAPDAPERGAAAPGIAAPAEPEVAAPGSDVPDIQGLASSAVTSAASAAGWPHPGVPSTPLSRTGLVDDSDAPVTGQRKGTRGDPLDPDVRHAAQLAPPEVLPTAQAPASGSADPPQASARASLEGLLPDLVRRIAWSGDGRRGSMRLELGAGALAGGTLVVHADLGRVRVELDAPAGVDTAAWTTRLEERLTRRGLDVDEVLVK